ncbi:uncharacterized protein LOC114193391 isoform X1 [Vigna unguiculata]|uniref:uncharacterized protein LOC114193391 isoform X1 n=1 Tax=Vigna unguiculata TaxID=3917 RepID=UPI0010167A67|nr:uncharacterized protein LOC114193391 isoform X1 [Vigna unguiculata]XP_027938959.1 uncharacterized protein LOC114193391 isoform X1 [Vigna unguiculata]XP_027938960.1 uncharacterized protein LOC114193391 isoform X1 [Vigna unguiculata]XP_027938961.1 uncharacterized protein LOC114193391 isoform X1 [Vigna unguiculata]
MAPAGIDRDHWASFVDYRLNSKTKEHALKNKDNRAKQTIAHTCGSKSIARKRDEMEKECGHSVSRGEVWIATHKHANEAFVSDEAREISEKIQVYESTSSSSVSKEISSIDSLAFAFGSQEHCGRVRGLGLGPCPSKVFGSKGHSYSGTSSSYPSNAQLQNQVSTLTSQLNEMKAMVNFLVQNYQGELPHDFTMHHAPTVSDQGSVPNEETNDQHQAPH